MKKLIYIAGKLNDDAPAYIEHLRQMNEWAYRVMSERFAVHVPGNDIVMGLVSQLSGYNDYFDNNAEILRRCDAMFVCPGWETSEGTRREIELCQKWDIPVFFALDELIEHGNTFNF